MRFLFLAACLPVILFASACAQKSGDSSKISIHTGKQASYCGNYSGSAIHNDNPFGDVLIENLEITAKDGVYKLGGMINATNREEGMDHTSNTRNHWEGTGSLRGNILEFSYIINYGDNKPEKETGILREQAKDYILTLDTDNFRLEKN